jgi:hypothetical protein
MQKRLKRSFYWKLSVVVAAVLFLAFGAFAEDVVQQISGVTNETKSFVEDFVKGSKIEPQDIKSIEQIDLQNPPPEVQVEHVDDTNIAVYQVNYTKNSIDRKVFVVTYATPHFLSPADVHGKNAIVYLNFGENSLVNDSLRFLKTSTGVQGSREQGYVMVDAGSLTGLSTNIEIVHAVDGGRLDVVIYKNGEATGLRNLIDASESGVKKDYDSQSAGIVTFVQGDVISVVVESHGNIAWKDDITLIKLEIDNS